MGEFRREGGGRPSFGGSRGGFGGGRRDGGRPSFGGSRGGFGGDRGPVTMHQATCDQCHKPCEVPFRPTEGKPVYCNECFGGKKESGDRGGDRFPRKSFDSARPARNDFAPSANRGSDDGVKKQLEAISTKLDALVKSIELMSKPVSKAAPVEIKEKKAEVKKVEVKVADKKPKAKVVVAKKKAAKK
jgi:CxxC-x17-CxxC domain-containing protein